MPNMKVAKLQWITRQLVVLAEAHEKELTAERLKIYADSLADLSQPQLQIAIDRALKESKFFPKIAELRELAGVPSSQVMIAIEADAAWSRVLTAARSWSPHRVYLGRHPETGEPTYEHKKRLAERDEYALRQVGGIKAVVDATAEQLPWVRKAFDAAFARSISVIDLHTANALPPAQEPSALLEEHVGVEDIMVSLETKTRSMPQ